MHFISSIVKKYPMLFVVFLLVLTLYVVLVVSDRFRCSDFQVEYIGAQHVLNGQPIYFQELGLDVGVKGAIYKYSPFTIFFFMPLAFLPVFWARTLYFFTICGFMIFAFVFLERLISRRFFSEEDGIHSNLIFLWLALITGVHWQRELHMANHNALLLVLLLLALACVLKRKEWVAGILIAWVMLMKPHFAVFFPLLLLRKQAEVLISLFATLLFGLLSPALFLGWKMNQEFHIAWFQTMLEHNQTINSSKNTLQAWLYKSGLNLFYAEPGQGYNLIVIMAVAALFLFFVLRNFTMERQISNVQGRHKAEENSFIMEYFVMIALIPNIVVTDTEHFLWSLPIVTFLVTYLVYEPREKKLFVLPLSVVACIFYGGDWYELWGRTLSQWIEKTGFLGLGNMFIILIVIFIFRRKSEEIVFQ